MKKIFMVFLSLGVVISMCSCGVDKSSVSQELNSNNEAIEELSSSYFKSSSVLTNTNNIGLSDYHNVGVDEEKFYNEAIYDFSKYTFDVTIDASSYGLNGTDEKDDTLAFIRSIEEVRKHQGETVLLKLPAGDLDFIEGVNTIDPKYGIVLKSLKNLFIKGDNTNIYFHGETRGFLVEDCENLHFEGINIDWGIPPTSTGKILSSDGHTFIVQVNNGYVVNEATRISAFLEYNKTSFTPRTRGNDIYGDVESTNYLGDNKLEITFKSTYSIPPVGTLVALRHYLYEYDCFFINESNSITFENINMYSAPGMGARIYDSSNLYFNHFNVRLKEDTDRLISCTADALHFIDCYGDVVVKNSLFENCGDDALNAHGMYLSINEVTDSNTIKCVNPRGYNFRPNIGDTIEVQTKEDLTLIQTLTVKKVIDLDPGFEITFEEEVLNTVKQDMVLGNATKTPKLIFQNNVVRNKRCRGILVQTREALIENNTFANLSDAGVLLTSDANEWYESINSKNVTIRNNKFLKNNFGVGNTLGDIAISSYGKGYNLASIGSIENITIENNFFSNSANGAIFANSCDGITISNNLINNVSLLPKSKTANSGIFIAFSRNIELLNNAIYDNAQETFKAISLGASVNVDTIHVENNLGFSLSDLESGNEFKTFNLTKLVNEESLSLTGLDFSDWEKVKSTVEICGITDVDQNELDFNTNTFKVNHLVVAYDENGLYLGYDIYDDEIIYANTDSFWEGDGVEIFLSDDTTSKDPLSVLKITNKSSLELFMSGSATNGNQVVEIRTSEEIMAHKDEIIMSFAEKPNGKGYIGKAYLPFTAIPNIKTIIENKGSFSLAINFIDMDSKGTRIQYATVYHPVEFGKYVPFKMSKFTTKEEE